MSRLRAGRWLVLTGMALGLVCGGALAARAATVPPKAAPSAPMDASTTTTTAATLPVPPVFAGDVQAFAVRMEVDEPLPAGPGDIPSVSGQVNAQEDFSTATTAVDLLGAVVGPKVSDPTGDGHQYAQLPQATCLYPSLPNTDSQSYPFDGSDQQAIQSQASCAPGPSATGEAYAGQIGGNAGVTNPNELQTLGLANVPLGVSGAVAGHESLGPDPSVGAVRVSADAEVNDFNIPGVLHVASVEATGYSQATGRPGGASTSAEVTVSGLTIGGSTISISPKGVQLGNQAPVPLGGAGPIVNEFNQAVSAAGCNLTVLSNPATYPQGPLFARPPLPNRVNPNGTDAGSTVAGALVRCVVPNSLNPTSFNPLIIQIVFGFVGTEADAFDQAGDTFTGSALSGPGPPPATVAVPAGGAPITAGSSRSPFVAPSGPAPASAAAAPPRSPPSRPALPNPTISVAPTRTLGALVSLPTTLEASGLAVAVVIALAGVALLAPWRVTLAPVDDPEL